MALDVGFLGSVGVCGLAFQLFARKNMVISVVDHRHIELLIIKYGIDGKEEEEGLDMAYRTCKPSRSSSGAALSFLACNIVVFIGDFRCIVGFRPGDAEQNIHSAAAIR